MRFPNWMGLSAEPDEIIGGHAMLRWWILPPNRWFNAYVHRHQANDPRFMHDHPCDNISIRIRGRIVEFTPDPKIASPIIARAPDSGAAVYFRADGSQFETGRVLPLIRRRRAEHAHRLELINGAPAWTVWIRFRNRRKWGFFEPTGWRLARSRSQPGA